ncbi:MAG: hypothetical protein ACIAXF_17320 [Phycisphaerales bacterium JB063]
MPRRVTLRTSVGQLVRVDREAGAILNVAVITVGKTKPSGNGLDPFDVDAVSLQQVADAINASEVGVKSRMTHPEVSGEDDITRRVGYIRNARVEGLSVRADMYFHNPGSDSAAVLFSIAETDPASCGLSIVSNTARLERDETAPTGIVLRLAQIDAVDWVGEPAANPTGMLSAATTNGANPMLTPEQIAFLTEKGLPEGADEATVAAFIAGLGEADAAAFAALAPAESASLETEEEKPAVAASEEEEEKPVAASTAKKKPAANEEVKDVKGAVALALKAERERMKQIRGIALKAGKDEKWIEKQLDSDAEVGEIALAAINTLKREPNDMPTSTSTITLGRDGRDSLAPAIRDAILLRAGVQNFVKTDEAGGVILGANRRPEARKPHERVNEFRGHTVVEMGRRYLTALGYRDADSMGRAQLATLLMSRAKLQAAMPGVYLAHSTGDFPYILADVMGKQLRAMYALAPHTWKQWCRSTTAPDFKTIKKIQLSEASDLVTIPEGDEYTYTTLTEGQETYALTKKGLGLKFTWESLINDDLDAFSRQPQILANSAARAVEKLAIGILTANAALADTLNLFSSGHSNLATGTLSVTSLGAARALLRKQTALGSDDPLELTPRYLLVPETIATTAQQLVSSTVDPALANATPNPFANTLQVIPSARLDTDSTAQWYLLADPNEIDTVEVAFLEGEETPVVEEEDEFDSDCRKMKIRHSMAAKAIDYRGMVRSSGS